MILPWWYSEWKQNSFMNVTTDVKSTANKAVTRQSQAYPRELGKAIVSAWLTARVRQESSGYIVGLQGHAGLKANDPKL